MVLSKFICLVFNYPRGIFGIIVDSQNFCSEITLKFPRDLGGFEYTAGELNMRHSNRHSEIHCKVNKFRGRFLATEEALPKDDKTR